MKCLLDKDVLTIYLEGELNSANADAREKEILADVEGKTFTRLVLDFSLLSYISSAGLRVVLKLKQKFGDVVINEASLEVYDVLSMTGFTNIMEVNKALNRISLDGAEVIGSGYFSTVYRINKDTIIKVFNRVSDSKQIERELKLSKEAFVLGIPTAISFDVVKVEDKLGVRFEMLDCESLSQAFARRPDQYNALLDKYVGLLKKINTTECLDPEIPEKTNTTKKPRECLKGSPMSIPSSMAIAISRTSCSNKTNCFLSIWIPFPKDIRYSNSPRSAPHIFPSKRTIPAIPKGSLGCPPNSSPNYIMMSSANISARKIKPSPIRLR